MSRLLRVLGKEGRITIPYEMRKRAGFSAGDVVSFTEMDNGQGIAVRRETLCDTEKGIPLCRNDEMTLFDFLNNLSPEQQRAALIHLSVKWAEKQGEKGGEQQ